MGESNDVKIARPLFCVLRPCTDIPGAWLGHCLNTDVISQGHGVQGAAEALGECIQLCMDDDAEQGLDFYDRPAAPAEYWSGAADWHYLPGEMPEDGQEVLAVLHCVDEDGREHTWFSTGGYERGRVYLDGGDEESIYAWRPLPDPPPVSPAR